MQSRQHFSYGNVWKVGNVIGDRHDKFMIGFDRATHKYRLVDLENGNILSEEYDTPEELHNDNPDYDPLHHAELVYA